MKSAKNYNFTFMRRTAARYKTGNNIEGNDLLQGQTSRGVYKAALFHVA